MDLLGEAKELGERCGWIQNREMDTGVVGSREASERRDALERLGEIADVVGAEGAEGAFAEGYDATIDFSLNTNWREPEAR